MRKYVCCYAQGRPGERGFRKLVATIGSPDESRTIVYRHFPQAITAAHQ